MIEIENRMIFQTVSEEDTGEFLFDGHSFRSGKRESARDIQ